MRKFFLGMAATMSVIGGSGAAQIPVAPALPALAANDPNVIALYTDIMRTIAGVPAAAGHEQAEAQIAYTVDQSEENCRVVVAALRQALGTPRQAKPITLALRDVLSRAIRCDPYGTAAPGGSAGTLAQGPVVGIGGGGTSNYSTF